MSAESSETPDLLKQAQRCFRKGEFPEAVRLFQAAIAEDETNVRAHRGLAVTYFQTGKHDQAAQHFTRVTQLDLMGGAAWINLGAIYNIQEKFQQAVDVIRKGLAKERRSAVGFYNLGLAHIGLKQHSMAVSGFKEALKIDPDMLDAHIGLANVYLDMKNYQMAISHFQEALRIDPQSKRAQAGFQEARDAADDARHAISPFGRLVDMDNLGLKSNIVLSRELTPEEQVEDRQAVRTLSTQAFVSSQDMLQQLANELVPSILDMNRSLAEGANAPAHLLSSFEKFQESVKQCHDLRQQHRRNILEIRAHEEMINTPDFGLFSETPPPPARD